MSTRLNQEGFLVGVPGVTSAGNVRLNQLALLLLTPSSVNSLQVQIIGGPFQDALGNPLSNGYLIMQLQHDAVALNTGQIVGNASVRIPLDINGRIQGTVTGAPVFIWPNSALLPAGGNYLIWAYDSANRLVWDNPQVQVVGATNPFNVNVWVPGP
jgi:hypothetical protein